MADERSKAKRSYIMSRIRSRDTKPELLLRKALWAKNIRFRTHAKDLPGKPDIVIRKYKLAIFVDGEFWHGYDWENKKLTLKTNPDFWIAKIERNIARDQQNREDLANMGYTVFRFWEQQVRKELGACVNQVQLFVEASQNRIPDPY